MTATTRRPPRRRARRVLLGLAIAVLAIGGALWLARDLPRRFVERAIAAQLGAEVRLGSLRVLSGHRFVLGDLEVRRMAGEPRLVLVRVRTVDVEGRVGEIRNGRFETLQASGVELTLAPSTVPAAPAEPMQLAIERFELDDAVVTVRADGLESRVRVSASLTGLGRSPGGTVALRAGSLDPAPWIALATPAGGEAAPAPFLAPSRFQAPELELDIERGGDRLVVRGRSASIELAPAGREPLQLSAPSIEMELTRDPASGEVTLEARPRLPGVDRAAVSAVLDAGLERLVSLQADLGGIDVGAWTALASALPATWTLRGRADVRLHVSSPERVHWEVALALDEVELPPDSGSVRARDVRLEGSGSAGLAGLRPGGRIDFDVRAGAARCATATLSLLQPALTLAGGIDLERRALEPTVARLTLAGGAVAGQAPPPGELFPLTADWSGRPSSLVEPALDGDLVLRAPGLGPLSFGGSATWNDGRPGARGSWTLASTDLRRLLELARAWGIDAPPLDLAGDLSAAGTLRGGLEDPAVAGTLRIASARAAVGQATFDGAALEAHCERASGAGELRCASFEAAATLAVPPLPPVPATLRARVVALVEPPGVRIEEAELRAGDLALVRLAGAWNPQAEAPVRATVSVEDAKLERWRPFLRPWIGDPAPGYAVKGTAGAQLSVETDAGGGWSAGGTARLADAGFSSDDGSKVLDGLAGTWELALAGRPDDEVTVDAAGPLGGFVVLWGAVFGDYGAAGADLRVQGAFRPESTAGAPEFWRLGLAATLPDGIRLDASAEAAGAQQSWTIDLGVPDVAATFETFARTPLSDSLPALSRVSTGGGLHVALAGSHGEEIALRGSFDATALALEGLAGESGISGLDLNLPVDLRWSAPDADGTRALAGGLPASGSVRFEALRLAGIELPATETALVVTGDSVALEQELPVPLLGGRVVLRQLRLADLLQQGRRLESALRIEGVDLRALALALDAVPLEGRLDGEFPRVRATADRLQVDGGGEVRLFGGRIAIGEISGENLLGRFPKLGFSATFDGIDLALVTRTFDVGEMGGFVRGELRDCELFAGVPVRFEADVATAEGRGSRRRINVKAINNIAILGTGGKIGIFDRGIHKFLDTYTYSRLGVRMKLERDVFVLRGLELRGGRELFLKGRLPFPIDVVNVKPGQTVSFRTMRDRLQRLDLGSVRTGP